MAITFNKHVDDTSGATHTLVIDPAATANDVLIIGAVTDSAGVTWVWPSGFTEVCNQFTSTDGQAFGVSYKGTATGSEGSLTTTNGGNDPIGFIASFTGCDNTTPLDIASPAVVNDNTATASAWTIDSGAFTPATAGAWIVAIMGSDTTSGADAVHTFSNVGSGSAGTWIVPVDLNNSFKNIALGYAPWTSGEIVVRGTGTIGGASAGRSMQIIVLRPAAANGSTGTVAKTNENDASSASGTTAVTGTTAKTNANDTPVVSGTTTILGALARTNANDSVAASGSPMSNGSVAYTNSDDPIAANGIVGAATGTVVYTNINDGISASGWAGMISGTVAYTNNDDSIYAVGTAPTQASDVLLWPGAYDFLGRRKKKKLDKEELEEIKHEIVEILEFPIEESTLSAKKTVYKTSINAISSLANNVKSFKKSDHSAVQKFINNLEIKQRKLQQAIKQQEDEDAEEDEAVFLLMYN